MPSSLNHWLDLALPHALRLIGIFVIALVLNRLLRAVSNLVIKQASAPGRPAQLREQQTRTLAGVLYGAGSRIVWVVALLTAVREFDIDITAAVTLAGLASLAIGFGAQTLVRDVITGFYIVLEDQYVVGDTIQFADYIGRVEHLTLRRTVIRDARGALVTIANGEIRTVSKPQPRLVAGVRGRLAGTRKPDRENIAGVGDRRGRFAGRSSLVTSAGRRAADSWGAELRPQFIDDTLAGADGADTAG